MPERRRSASAATVRSFGGRGFRKSLRRRPMSAVSLSWPASASASCSRRVTPSLRHEALAGHGTSLVRVAVFRSSDQACRELLLHRSSGSAARSRARGRIDCRQARADDGRQSYPRLTGQCCSRRTGPCTGRRCAGQQAPPELRQTRSGRPTWPCAQVTLGGWRDRQIAQAIADETPKPARKRLLVSS